MNSPVRNLLSRLARLGLLLVGVTFLLPMHASAAPFVAMDLVSNAMDDVLLQTNNPFLKVIKQGSWISKEGYRNPLDTLIDIANASDHDARLFIALDDVSPERAREVWKGFQGRLRKTISERAYAAGLSTDDVQRLLRSVNFYPPAQMLKGIEQNEQAIEAFLRRGNYPNLLEVGAEGAEGIYTKATKFIRQGYETGARVQVAELIADEGSDFFRVAHKASAEAEHVIEGVAAENMEGYVQASEYGLNEARTALKKGNLDIARKNLARAKDKLQQARRLAGVNADGAAVKEIDALERKIDEAIERAFSGSDDAATVIGNARSLELKLGRDVAKKTTVEFAALESTTVKSSIRQRAMVKGVLEGEGKWAGLRLQLEEVSENAITTLQKGARLAYKHWFVGLITLWELKEFPEAIHKEGVAKASVRLATTIGGLVNPPFGFLQLFSAIYMAVGELLVDWMSSYGYDAVASRQDCMDLMAGIYTVPGREQQIFDQTCEQIQDDRQLACRIYDQHQLRSHLARGYPFREELVPPLMLSLLTCHAKTASKHYDDVESKHDEGIEQALFKRCINPVLKTWLASRQFVINEIDALRQGVEGQSVTVIAAPLQLKSRGSVALSLRDVIDSASLKRELTQRAACLGGVRASPRFYQDHVWTVNGRQFDRSGDRGSTVLPLESPGTYQACVAITYEWRVEGLESSLEEGLTGKWNRQGCATITVTAPPADPASVTPVAPTDPPPPVEPPKPATKAPAPSCAFEYSAWGECNRASKTQTRSVTSRKPAGCVESAKPALEQGCTPPPTEEDKRNAYLNCLCRCSSGWAGHIGVWYDPEQKTVPECKSSGPCIGGIGAWGCSSRHYFVGPNDCAKGCWDSAFGKDSYDPAKADKMRKDENKKFKQPLKVKIAASKNPADFGDIVDLTATATEGSGGYHDWNWGGCAQDAKETQAKVLNSRSCSACQATVSVTDNDGDTASDSLTIQCTALKVKLTKESPKENRIPVGGQAKFFAEVFSGDKPAGGSFSYIWERNPDAIFGDPKNPAYETQGGSQSRNSAVFRKLGTTPVWVSVLKDIGGKKTTVGESEQIPIEVVSPKLTLAAEPKDALVGQEVKISVTEDPKMSDDLLSFWWEIAGDANNPGPVSNVPNSRAYSFKSKNDRPVTVTVHAKAKDGGDELGVEKITLTAKKPAVTVSGPKIAGPAPMIWKEGVGLVTVGQQIAEAQRVEFAVAVAPDPKQDLRYQWTVAPEGCSITAPASKETGVTCSKVGGYTMTATVKNADGAELGSGAGSLSVTISLSDITKGKQKDEANKKLVRAKELWGQKNYDEAVTEGLAASVIDGAIAAPVLGQFGTESKAMGAAAVAAGDYAAAQKHYERALRINPADQDAKTRTQAAQAKAARVAELKPKVAKVAQDPALPAKGVLDQARADADELVTLLPGNAEAQGYRQRIQEKLQALAARDEKAAQAKVLRDEGAALQQQGKLGEAIAKYRGSLALLPDRALEDHIRQIEGQLAAERQKQQQATALWNEGRALYDAGKPQDALAKFRDSVKLWPDAANQRYIAELEAKLTQNRSRAQQLRGEAEALQQQGRVAEAIGKFKESLTLVPDRALEDHIRQLEGRLAADRQKQSQAAALWNEGRAQFDAGKPQEALAKFRDSVKLWPDAGNQRYIADLEAQLAQQAQRKAEAQRLRDEAYGLQQQNRLPEAVRKYRESLALWPDPELERHVRQIEAVMNAPPVAPPVVATPSYPVSPPSSPSTPQPVIYENGNAGGVGNGPTRATTFTLNSAHAITLLQTYHWNNGRGATPGTIGLRDVTGRMWGPWAVRTTPGQGGVPNAYWNTNPNVVLPSGVYTVVDSDPSSWAQNSGSQGAGFVRVEGHAAGGRSYTSAPRDSQPVPAAVSSTGATRVLSAVASAPSTQFKQRTIPAFQVDTTIHDKLPYLVTSAYDGALRIGSNQSVYLAGNAAGTAGWRVDNFVVVELEWSAGSKAFWIGSGENLSRNGQRLAQVGPMAFDQGPLDITAQIPRNVDLRVRISALDYGGVGFVSDVYLVVR